MIKTLIKDDVFGSEVHLYVDPNGEEDEKIKDKYKLEEVYDTSSFYEFVPLLIVVIIRRGQGDLTEAVYHEAGHVSHRIEANLGIADSSGEFVLYLQGFYAKKILEFITSTGE